MRRQLPPLNAVRAFEAAARHQSFALAAEELSVTPAAISQQVRLLEARLDIALFQRLNNGLRLTEAGRAYLPALSAALDELARASARVQASGLRGTVTVSALGSFAVHWLAPRVAEFSALYPELDLYLHTDSRVIDFAREDVDLAIRYGDGHYDGLEVRLLMGEDVFPVCSPTLLNGPQRLESAADLRHFTLLHDRDAEPYQAWISWPAWFAREGISGVDTSRGPRFSSSGVLIAAAVAGQGVALGRSALVGHRLDSGQLVRPLPQLRRADWSYWLVAPPAHFERPKVRAFVDWLLQLGGQSRR
ncbi:transcriptional regulator GcvA [Plasticicumulans acidivorans]|uniref:LysR family transcriptional regulator n=1 Tax=Plasticicumulans acidivorans TaxID=886464 RepID=A0A317MWM0_9GAMM|nr:transcriptional regulator GcvA [Plasticicumulans acidivorans]PWV63140.1 LysR family transcriptional regulator [Plasticicumulans acidivorans]